jgi:hypothetical protein
VTDRNGDGSAISESGEEHWFAGKELDVLIYRVNRRPLATSQPSLFTKDQAVPILVRLNQVLDGGVVVRSGRRYQREWRIGNKRVVSDGLSGMVGWSRQGEVLANIYDEASQSWQDRVVSAEQSAVAPFAFTSSHRFLGVLRHPSFNEVTIAYVFTEMLNRGEQRRDDPAVQWAVEPVGDRADFDEWLDSMDSVTELRFVFRRPNPDAEEAFADLFGRLDLLKAEQIAERITPSDKTAGLDKDGIREDRVTQGFLAAAMLAFGYVVGRGYRAGRKASYDQRDSALRERVANVDSTWDGAANDVLQAVRRVDRRRKRDG